MTRNRFLTSLAAAALGVSLLGACSAESLTEFGLERAFEANGEDIDLDFGENGFNISTDEGDFSFGFDGDNGGFSFDSDEGSGSLTFDDEGNFVLDTPDGSATGSVSEDGVVYTDENGQQTSIAIDAELGTTTFASDEGTFVAGQDVPADWPDFIGVPATLVPAQSYFTTGDDGSGWTFGGSMSFDPAEDYFGTVVDRMAAAGFETITATDNYGQWQGSGFDVVISASPGAAFIVASPTT